VLAVGISVSHALFGASRCQILFIVAENLRKNHVAVDQTAFLVD
jgi:uncharacterized protein YoaH (UPF0181 family)